MKTLMTVILCALFGAILALMGPFALKLFNEYVAIAKSGVSFDWAALLLFLIIGLFASVAFIAGHCFTALNKKISTKIEAYFKFLDD